jgi:hypothetical protein
VYLLYERVMDRREEIEPGLAVVLFAEIAALGQLLGSLGLRPDVVPQPVGTCPIKAGLDQDVCSARAVEERVAEVEDSS